MRGRQEKQPDRSNPAVNGPAAPGGRLIFWGSLLLFAWAVYELGVRMEAAWPPLKMFVSMAVGERVPLDRVMRYVDYSILTMPLYLLGCALLGVFSLAFRKRAFAALAFVPLAAAAVYAGTRIDGLFSIGFLRAVKAIPPALVGAGYIANAAFALYGRRRGKKSRNDSAMPAGQDGSPTDGVSA